MTSDEVNRGKEIGHLGERERQRVRERERERERDREREKFNLSGAESPWGQSKRLNLTGI